MASPSAQAGLGVPGAPVYTPDENEFKNPLEYIAKIRPEAEQYGICKIVPPASWQPPFMIDKDAFEFNTRIQVVSELQNKVSSSPEYKSWNTKYLQFLKTLGKGKKRNPTFNGREIELFKLHKLVQSRGGYHAVCDRRGLWREVAGLLGVRPAQSGSRTVALSHNVFVQMERYCGFTAGQQCACASVHLGGGIHAPGWLSRTLSTRTLQWHPQAG